MSLREQLLKTGLASKQQAKRAERDVKKQKHESLQAKKNSSPEAAPSVDAEAQKKREEQREADRERNRLIEEERQRQEARARAIDVMLGNDLSDPRAKETYYFRYHETKIGYIRVNEVQQVQLAQGQLAIASFDVESRFFLLSPENAVKVKLGDPSFLLCYHSSSEKPPEASAKAEA